VRDGRRSGDRGGELASGALLIVGERADHQYLHLVKAVQGERFQIGNNRGGINGWITRRQIFGRLLAVEP